MLSINQIGVTVIDRPTIPYGILSLLIGVYNMKRYEKISHSEILLFTRENLISYKA